jgi:predicted metal-dependent phosphotriesterase family hydrolase
MAQVRTVNGDLDPHAVVGAVAGYVHLAPDWRPISDRDPEVDLPSETRLAAARTAGDNLCQVMSSLQTKGFGLIVDATPPGAGRDPMRLHDVAVSTGMEIVACTGAHAPPARLARTEDRSAEFLAEWFAFELGSGMAAIAGDAFRGVPLMSERAAGVAGDALNDAAIRAGAIRITLASPVINRVDGALIDAAAIAAEATGVATFFDAPPSTDLQTVASRFEASGGHRSKIILAPGTRSPDALLAAASLGLSVVVTAPATGARGAVAIWEGTIRGLLRHGLIAHVIATTATMGFGNERDHDQATTVVSREPYRAIEGVDESEFRMVTASNALRILGIT